MLIIWQQKLYYQESIGFRVLRFELGSKKHPYMVIEIGTHCRWESIDLKNKKIIKKENIMRNQRVGSVLISIFYFLPAVEVCWRPSIFNVPPILYFSYSLLALFDGCSSYENQTKHLLAFWIILYLLSLLIVAWPFVVIHSFQPFQFSEQTWIDSYGYLLSESLFIEYYSNRLDS